MQTAYLLHAALLVSHAASRIGMAVHGLAIGPCVQRGGGALHAGTYNTSFESPGSSK